ncbi:hypothetical protein [Shimia haliotis]|uniref:Uncharacterized protein n=1 Tax=Shimia haliotis TaxID=1280847 RepID=A0A1I4B500_9RHOB|nr:hypothetical protein [Shimia haliotis]SFK63794.1 hypothetical protein SAMN04488036_101810 [Shimia haliotis]
MFRIPAALALIGLTLSACGPTSHVSYTKPNVSNNTANRNFVECRQEANALFPAAIFTESVPGYGGYGGYYGGSPYYPGWGGSYVQASDANAPLRAQHLSDCMTLKGYQRQVHPICTSAQLDGRQYQPVTRPPASAAANICAARTQGGGTTLIDLSKPL